MADISDRAVLILETSDEFIVPVKWLWKRITEDTAPLDIALDDFCGILKEDDRFTLFESKRAELNLNTHWSLSEEEQEKMGFYQGPRVMLKNRVPSYSEVVAFLLKKVDQTFNTLKQAWDLRPKDDASVEDQLIEALAKAQKLQRELVAILSKEKEKEKSSS